MRRFFYFIFISLAFLTGALGSFLLFDFKISDENVRSEVVVSMNVGPEIEKVYQYAAPWDKLFFDNFYTYLKISDPGQKIYGGIVPHHLLPGHVIAEFFQSLKYQNPSLVLLVGPNHFGRGSAPVIATARDWQTPFGIVETSREFVDSLNQLDFVDVDEGVIAEEHSLYGLVPFVKKSLPDTKIVTLAIKNDISQADLQGLVDFWRDNLPADAVVVASIDFSHYQAGVAADFHDELSRNIIATFDYERINKLEIDSRPSLYFLLKMMSLAGAEKIIKDKHTNSSRIITGTDAKNITSYYSVYFGSGERKTGSAVSILHFGDMMLDRDVKKRINENGEDYLFGRLAGEENRFFSGMDLVVANLEGPFVRQRRQTTKEIAFSFDPSLLPMLKKYNFSLFNLANNHTYDMGRDGFVENKELLLSEGFDFFGQQYGVDDNSYIVKSIGDKRVAFLGFDDTTSRLDLGQVQMIFRKAELESDIMVVNIHWGEEYREISNERQRLLARSFIDFGADAVIGHHPHWVQEMEIYRNRPIFYSLGNFIFDQYFSINTQRGLGVGLVFNPDNISVYLFALDSRRSQVYRMDYAAEQKFVRDLVDRSRMKPYIIDNLANFKLPILSYEISQ